MSATRFFCENCRIVHSFNQPARCVTFTTDGLDKSIVEPYAAGLLRFIRRHGCTYEDLPIGALNHGTFAAFAAE